MLLLFGGEVLYNNIEKLELQLRRPRRGGRSKRQDGEEGSKGAAVNRGRKPGAETERRSVGCVSPGCPELGTEVSSAGPEEDKAHPATLMGGGTFVVKSGPTKVNQLVICINFATSFCREREVQQTN